MLVLLPNVRSLRCSYISYVTYVANLALFSFSYLRYVAMFYIGLHS